MKDSAYWQGRNEQLFAQVEKDEAKLATQLQRYYTSEAQKLSRDIASYYQRFGKENVLEYRALLVKLNDADRQLLFEKWDTFARKYPQYAHLMPVRESIYKLDYMESVRYSMQLQQLEIGAREIEGIGGLAESEAVRSAGLAAERLGFGTNFYTVNAEVVRLVVGARWADGKSFSDRVWDNKGKLVNYLHNEFAQGLARGVNYKTMSKNLEQMFAHKSNAEAMRLIRTEGTFVLNEAQRQAHLSMVEEPLYSLSTVTDSHGACPICLDIERMTEQNPVPLREAQPGIDFPPIHPNCRCSYTIATGSEEQFIADMRAYLWGE